MESLKRPLYLLNRSLNTPVAVRLKNNVEYRGRLIQCDNYMNLILDNAAEYSMNEPIAQYGNVFIRGNNILYISLDIHHT